MSYFSAVMIKSKRADRAVQIDVFDKVLVKVFGCWRQNFCISDIFCLLVSEAYVKR